jgi:stage V sporulation protein S
MERPEVLKVSTRSRPSAVAGAIAGVIRDRGIVEVQAIGAGATNQAIKAAAIARAYLTEDGIGICCVPSFIDVMIDDEERTAIKLLIRRDDGAESGAGRADVAPPKPGSNGVR